jgi:hypothetical protein
MLKTRTIKRVIVIHTDVDLALAPLVGDKKHKQAAYCLKDFFLRYPDAFGAGRYEVEMFRSIPRMRLYTNVFKLNR